MFAVAAQLCLLRKRFTCFPLIVIVLFWTNAGPSSGRADEKSNARQIVAVSAEQIDEKSEPTASRMLLEITINRPSNTGRGYRRPYIAAWLTDKDGFPVRTILLWIQQDAKGRRWVSDLRKWNADDRIRGIVDDKDLVDAVSGPTRAVGKHKVGWDGLDDNGAPLPAGTYMLHIEAAREHGTYQIIREQVELGEKPFERELKGNEEIRSVHLKYSGAKVTNSAADRQ